MKASEIREIPTEELTSKIEDVHREMVEIKLKGSIAGEESELGRIGALRRDIARMKTVIRERELAT